MKANKAKRIADWGVAIGGAVLIAALVVLWLDLRDSQPTGPDRIAPVAVEKSSISTPVPATPWETNVGPTKSMFIKVGPSGATNSGPTNRVAAFLPMVQLVDPPSAAPKASGRVIVDPLARVALAAVGADFAATVYWMGAINDPSVPAEERKDLIEDLNEDGFVDPKHPSPAELPLILSRLALIEEIAADAMDGINAGAFAEAYKDLLGMAQGKPPD